VADAEGKARAEQYKAMAAEAYAVASQMTDPEAQRVMHQLALTYDRLAMGVEEWGQQPVIPTFVSDRK
jgi:hypothetical protein